MKVYNDIIEQAKNLKNLEASLESVGNPNPRLCRESY